MRKRFRIWHLNEQNICAKIRQYIRKAYAISTLKFADFMTENCWYQWLPKG